MIGKLTETEFWLVGVRGLRAERGKGGGASRLHDQRAAALNDVDLEIRSSDGTGNK